MSSQMFTDYAMFNASDMKFTQPRVNATLVEKNVGVINDKNKRSCSYYSYAYMGYE